MIGNKHAYVQLSVDVHLVGFVYAFILSIAKVNAVWQIEKVSVSKIPLNSIGTKLSDNDI